MTVRVGDAMAFASGSLPANAIPVEEGTGGAEEVEIDLDKVLEVMARLLLKKRSQRILWARSSPLCENASFHFV